MPSLDHIFGTVPISGDFVLSANYRHEVVGMFFSLVFDYKVINDKSEIYGDPFVCDQTSGAFELMVSSGVKALHEALVGKNSDLEKAIHALLKFNNKMSLVKKRGTLLLFHDGVGYVLDRDVYVSIVVEGCYKIVCFDISGNKLGTGC